MPRYRVSVPVIEGYSDFFVTARSKQDAIDKVEQGEFEEGMTESDISYDFGDATAEKE